MFRSSSHISKLIRVGESGVPGWLSFGGAVTHQVHETILRSAGDGLVGFGLPVYELGSSLKSAP